MRMKIGLNAKQMEDWKAAWDEGHFAGQCGLSYYQNPYKTADPIREDGWRRGWTAASYNNRGVTR